MTGPSLPHEGSDISKLIARVEVLERMLRDREPLKLNDLADVRVSTAVDTNDLEFDETNKLWIPGAGGGSGGGVITNDYLSAYLGSTTITSGTVQEFLDDAWIVNVQSAVHSASIVGDPPGTIELGESGLYFLKARATGSVDGVDTVTRFGVQFDSDIVSPVGWGPDGFDYDSNPTFNQVQSVMNISMMWPFSAGAGSKIGVFVGATTLGGSDFSPFVELQVVRVG